MTSLSFGCMERSKLHPSLRQADSRPGTLRRLQRGERLEMPHSRPMPSIGPRCHELRIDDGGVTWRIIYRTDPDALIILDVFSKKAKATPKTVIEACRRRLKEYDNA